MFENPILDEFMEHHRFVGMTYDDVTLLTQYADFVPVEADLATQLTREIRMNLPFVSAAMDTVTESLMGITMALAGGIGIVHKNLEPQAQRTEVKKVKYYLNGFLAKARALSPEMTIAEVEQLRREKGFRFSSFPVLDADRRLLGIVTASQFRYAESDTARISDIMVTDTVTARPSITVQEAYATLLRHKISILPVVQEDGTFLGLYSFKDLRRIVREKSGTECVDASYSLRVGAAVGPADQERVECLMETAVDVLVVDTAHGHTRGVIDMVKWIKARWPGQQVVAGNVGAAEGAVALADAGADAVKVGIGPGSICTTRVVGGVGVPQFSAVYNCARALRGRGVPVIADGGVRHSGDVAKALAAGACCVMMGGALAGTDESPGERVLISGRQYMAYRGMGSLGAMQQRHGSADRYSQKGVAGDKLVPEGIEGLVPYSGPATGVLHQFAGGLRASMGYQGCRTVADVQRRGRVIRVTAAGKREAHPHDVQFMRDTPNYRTVEEE